ncbi:MAG: hypothetical protein OEM38_12255 [Gammaproteobacteria bacterium]|nr:hypothetical protein [Gammaproteobacteria bacterium]
MILKKAGYSNQLRKTLHVVSEQKTAFTIESSGLEGDVLVWQDALYEGPILDEESLNGLSAMRADYFSRLGWGDYSDILALFSQRNQIISNFLQFNEIVLWFDSGLNNQLQMIQLINWFSKQQTRHVVISIVSTSRLADVIGFVDFALLKETQLEKLYRKKTELTNSQTEQCNQAWRALTSKTPVNLLKFFPRDMSSMPYLKNAILRFVQQFPSKKNGLCKTEQLIIHAIKNKRNSQDDMEQIYLNVQGKEPIPFMSRAIFYAYMQKLIMSPHPLIEKRIIEQTEALQMTEEDEIPAEVVVAQEYELKLTKISGQVTNNWVDWVQVNGIDRWLGGVHLREGNIWRYNAETRQLMKTYV